jgi:hypothetical protein
MLSDQEQRALDEMERSWDVLTDDPRDSGTPPGRRPAHVPTAVVAGSWAVILLTLFGQLDAVLVVGLLTALYWALWRLTRART